MADLPSPFNHDLELSLTRDALEEGDYFHAAQHLASLIVFDPIGEEHKGLLDSWMRRAGPDGLQWLASEESDNQFFGQIALRAELLSRLGSCDESVKLILTFVGKQCDARFLTWLTQWIDRMGWLEGLDLGHFVKSVEICLSVMKLANEDVFEGLLKILEILVLTYPEHERLNYMQAVLARRAGDDRAMEMAEECHEEFPGYWACLALGGALREEGELEKAIELYQEGLDYEPQDIGLRLDLGDLLHDAGDLEASLDIYEEALDIEPGQPVAAASTTYLRYSLEGDLGLRDELDDMARSGNRRALRFLFWLETYRTHLPTPDSSIVTVAIHAVENKAQIESLTISSLEPPSAIMALDYSLKSFHAESIPKLSFTEIPEPDPRKPRKLVRNSLWVYKGKKARPAMEPPSMKVAHAISTIAQTPYDSARWSEMARLQAGRFRGLEDDILATMCQPPPLPANDEEPWSWPFRVQVVAAMLLSRSPHSWKSRRKTLRELLFGVVDWTSTAAIIAMTQLAEDEPELGYEIFLDLIELFGEEEAGPIWYQCILYPLFQCLPRLPLPLELRTIIVGLRARAGLP
jgi:tetratricopeptide (TPR) repeat protein